MAPKIYEIRIYSMNVWANIEFLRIVDNEDFWKMRTSFAKCIGVWRTELNGLFEYIHFAEYDDLDHLLRTREEMAGNQDWNARLSPVADLKIRFTNVLVTLAPGSKVNTDFSASKTAVYELQTIPALSKVPDVAPGATVVGRFTTLYGKSRTDYRLIRYPDRASALKDAQKNSENNALAEGSENRLMVPLSVSDVQ